MSMPHKWHPEPRQTSLVLAPEVITSSAHCAEVSPSSAIYSGSKVP
jgi:hypothetical protein